MVDLPEGQLLKTYIHIHTKWFNDHRTKLQSQPPDQNPFENLWDELKGRVQKIIRTMVLRSGLRFLALNTPSKVIENDSLPGMGINGIMPHF